MKHPSIIYWKWEDEHLQTENYLEKIDDIVRRSCFDHICITTHWCENGIAHESMHRHVRAACERIHQLGRKMIFEIDVRAEKKLFAERYPDSKMGFIYWQSKPAAAGETVFSFPIEQGCGGELFMGDRQDGEALVCLFAYQKDAAGTILPASVERIEGALKRIDTSTVTVTASCPQGKEMFAAVCSYYRFPDFWSAGCREFFTELMERYADIPLDGLSVDELGLLWYPDFDFTPGSYMMLDNAPVYGRSLAACFEEQYGLPYDEALLYRFCSSAEDSRRVQAINFYFDFIRNGLSSLEQEFYRQTKALYGPEAFVGVHATWFAIEEVSNTPEVWKTAITWWETKRDYGFTDEIMLYPVRTALAHKESAPIFYNMWYSEGTCDLDTYFTELYKNARYGGRTITLGYECRKEAGVLDLCKEGLLEQVSEIEEKFAMLDELQTTAAACDIAVLMGLEACCSRLSNLNTNGQWDFYRGILKEAFTLTRDISNLGYNADMIGSCAVEDGSLYLDEEGYLHYGSQQYKYLVMAYPAFCKPGLLAFLEQVKRSKTGLCVVGPLDRDFYGAPAALPDGILQFTTRPDAFDLTPLFAQYGAARNRVPNGCMMQDGSVILTHPAPDKPSGNRFTSAFTLDGITYQIEADDLVFFRPERDGQPQQLWSPNLIKLEANK